MVTLSAKPGNQRHSRHPHAREARCGTYILSCRVCLAAPAICKTSWGLAFTTFAMHSRARAALRLPPEPAGAPSRPSNG